MRTSLNKLQEIENFLMQKADTGDALVFEARMIVDNELAAEVAQQRDTYTVINQYGRRKLKAGLEAAHQQLFSLPKYQRFKERILAMFNG